MIKEGLKSPNIAKKSELFLINLLCYLFLRTSLGPELQQPPHHGFGESGVLLQELHHAVGELRVVQRQTLHFVQRQKHLHQELLVLALQRQGEAVYYTGIKSVRLCMVGTFL